MPPRKTKTPERGPDEPTLAQILQDDSSAIGDTYHTVDAVSIQRLVYTVTALGGMVTFWVDSAHKRLCYSMRLWGEHRSYQIDLAAQFTQVSEPVVEKLSKVLATKKLPPPPAYPAPKLVSKPTE